MHHAERSPAAWLMRRAAPCFHHALLLQRAAPRRATDPHAEPALHATLAALADLHLDDEARDLGLRSEHIAAARAALAAFLDECAANQPGGERWRDALFARAGLPRSANVGREFFETLEQRLALPAPGPADLAVLQIHATCLFLGLRGRYGAQVDAAESELQHQLRRLRLRLRPLLAPRPPPTSPPVPPDMPQRPPATALCVAALLVTFTLALIAGLRAQIHRHADELRSHLATVPSLDAPAPPPRNHLATAPDLPAARSLAPRSRSRAPTSPPLPTSPPDRSPPRSHPRPPSSPDPPGAPMSRLRPLAPWLLALLAFAWAGASHVPWDRLVALAPILALVLAAAIIVHLARRRRRAPDPARALAARRRRAVRRTVAAARRLRPRHIWLCLGLPRHGKTALLAAAGPHRDIAPDPDLSAPLLRLLDSTHDLTIEHPTEPRLLRRLRPRQPIDAIVLALSIPDLLDADPLALVTPLRAQLLDALVGLDVDPPIYLACTRLDRLAGHHELADASLWGFELAHLADLPQQLMRWSQWVRNHRLARIASELDPERRARLFTLGAQFDRLCERLVALAGPLFAPHHGAPLRLRGVHFVAARPDAARPPDALLTRLAAALHIDLRPAESPHPDPRPAESPYPARPPAESVHPARPPAESPHPAPAESPHPALRPAESIHPAPHPAESSHQAPRPTDLAPFFAVLRRRAPEAARSPAHRRRLRRRTHVLAAALALAALALAISAVAAADSHRAHLQRLADLTATLADPEPVPPLLALRAELDPPDPAHPGLARLLAPDLAPALLTAYRRAARERLLHPLWSALGRALERTLTAPTAAPTYDLLRAYLLLTAPAPSNMSEAPGPEDPAQSDWLLAALPRLADPATDTADYRLLLATFFAHATPPDLRFPRDHALVERVRARLHAQGDDEAVLRAALTAADTRCEPLTLAAISHAEHLTPGPAIACSFTRDGWPHVQEQLLRATERRSDWILGRPVLAHADADRLARLRDRHDALYVAAWTDFLAGIRVRRPVDLAGAAALLTELTGEDPPLTRLFKTLDHHTRGLQHLRPDERSLIQMLGGIDDPRRSAALARAFAPVLQFAIAAPDRQSGLDRYHARLAEVLGALEAARRDPAALPDLQTRLDAALADTHALLQPPDLRRFRPLLSALLLPPLTSLQSILRDHDRLALTAAYCSEVHAPLRRMAARYPFARDAHDELTLAEFTAFFHPETGALRRFRDERLAPLLVVHGADITARPTARGDDHPLAPQILALLHRAAILGELAFTGPEFGLDLDLDLHCNADIGRVTFTLDGATHSYTCGPDHRARMRWPGQGEPRGAVLELLGRDGRRETVPGRGPWGLWRLLEKDGVTLPPDDPAAARLVFRLDLRPGRLGLLDLALTPIKTRGATLFFGDPTKTTTPTFLTPLRAHELLDPPTALFTGLSTCDELPAPPD